MQQFNIVLNQVIIFLIVIIIGFSAVKLKFLNDDSLTVISKLFSNVTLPFMLFVNTVAGATRADLIENIYVILIPIAIYAVLIPLSLLMVKILHVKGNQARILRMCMTFGNVGFVGIPVISAIYGAKAMLYAAIFCIVDQLLVWSYGVSLSYPVDETQPRKKFDIKTLKNLLNPPLIATVLSLVVVMLNIQLPGVVMQAFTSVSNACMPLPFLYIGCIIALYDIRSFIKHWEFYVVILVKMIAFPVAAFLLMRALHLPDDLIGTVTVICGLPALGMGPMLARANGSDEEYATANNIVTTLACLITLTLVSYITTVLL
jgi:predicted permease